MNKKVVVIIILVFIILLLGFVSVFLKSFNPEGKKSILQVRDKSFEIELADTASTRSRGLSGRDNLADNQGMLFIFDKPASYGFWMKDMKFAIDIVWLSGNQIIGFSENLQPEPQKSVFSLPIYYPPANIDKVLEINAGAVRKFGLQIGDKISLR